IDLDQVVAIVEDELTLLNAFALDRLAFLHEGVLGYRLVPAVLNRLAEELGEIVHILRSHVVSLVALGLESTLSRVGLVDGLEMQSANLVRAADVVEDPLAPLRFALGVHLDLDDISGCIGDDDSQRVGRIADGIAANDAN